MSKAATKPLDRDATTDLAMAFLKDIKAHYEGRPTSQATVLEVLNALAAACADVIAGADQRALEFFLAAFHQNTASAIAQRDNKASFAGPAN